MKKFNEITSAIVLVEFQNQWTSPGLYHSLIKGQLRSRAVLENTRRLVGRARARGSTVIHAPLVVDPENRRGLLAHVTFGRVFTKGTEKSAITAGLFRDGDLVVEGRYAFDAFIGSNLEELLRGRSSETLFLAGFTTDQCVAKTLRTALRKGFETYMISDCTATMSSILQKRAEREFRERTVSSRDLFYETV
jgi:nicotinamidase-related amidase